MRITAKLLALVLCVTIAIWFVRKPFHLQYQATKALLRNDLAESLAKTSLIESPVADRFFPDFANLQRYRSANLLLPSSAYDRVVFYGDSITDFWPTTFSRQFFPGKPYIGRGITAQSTPGLVWRFQQDVLSLHPSIVVILAGTNDLIQPKSRLTSQQTIANIETMVRLAQRQGVRVIVCSILPVSHFPAPQQAAFTMRIQTINATLQSRAKQDKFFYLDYFSFMSDATGAMRQSLSPDGVHPNAAGYAVMEPLAQSAIDQVFIHLAGSN